MTAFQALRWSLDLDYQLLLRVGGIPFDQKVLFIAKKYIFFIYDLIFGLKDVSRTTVFGKEYYYKELFGLASLQRVYCASHGLKKLVPENPTVIDVGANVGQFTFFCRHYLLAKTIIAIEPVKECFDTLRLNTPVPSDCINCVISCEKGVKDFYVCCKSTQLSSCIKDEANLYGHGLSLPCQRLDDTVMQRNIQKIDILKIDTEGSEYDVLHSGETILGICDTIMVEMSVFRKADGNMFKTGSFLNDRGFDLISISSAPGERPKDADAVFKRR